MSVLDTVPAATMVCRLDDLTPERGVAALVDGHQIALFRVIDEGGDRVLAVAHRDPFSGANVLARGIVGRAGPTWYVASPLHKQRFDLVTGRCLSDPEVSVPTYRVEVDTSGTVSVRV